MREGIQPEIRRGYRERIYGQYVSASMRHSRGPIDTRLLDKLTPIYDAWFGDIMPSDKVARILDIGCGYGNFLRWASHRGYTDLEGIDLSQEQVDLAQRLCPAARITCDTWQAYLDGKEGQYDLIASLDVIEHLTRDEIIAFLDGSRAALKPGGALLLQTINGEGLTARNYIYGDLTHEAILSPYALSTALRITGFEEIRVKPTAPVAKNAKGVARVFLWNIITGIVTFVNLVETGNRGSGIVTRNMIAVARRPVHE